MCMRIGSFGVDDLGVRRFLVGFAALLGLLAITPVPASANDSFSVTGIKVDATAQSAAEAQGNAQNEGFMLAFQALLDRHVMRADQNRLDQIDVQTLSAMIRSFRVADEKRSATRYLASMSVSFKPDQFRYWLRSYAVPVSETPAKPSMILGVWAPKGSQPILWGDLNPWRQALEARETAPGDVVPLIRPDGDLDDLQSLTARQAMVIDKPALGSAAAKYGTDRYAVAALRLTAERATVSLYVQDPFGPRRWTVRYERASAEQLDDDLFLTNVADAIQVELDEDWKKRTLISDFDDGTLSLFVPITGLRDWEQINGSLDQAAGLRGVTVREMNTRSVLADIEFQGGINQLNVSLADYGLQIIQDMAGRHILSRKAGPGENRGVKAYPQ